MYAPASATTSSVALPGHIRARLRDFSRNGGTTDERRPSFQLYTFVIGGRRKHSSVRARRAREKGGSSGVQTRTAAATGQVSPRPSETGASLGTCAARRPAPAGSGAAIRTRKSTGSASHSACSSAPACSGARTDPRENTGAFACSGENSVTTDRPDENISACACSDENSVTANCPGENSVAADCPPRRCAAPANRDGAAARYAVQAAPRPAGSFQSTASSPDATAETHQ